MNGRMIGVIGGTGRVGRECLRYLHENTAFGLLIGGRKPPREALPGSFLSVDVFDEASLARFCGQCSLVINCAGPASAVRERVAAAALAGGCHYVDPGGYTPLFPILSSRRPEIRAKRLTFLLTLGILPGLSELFPVYVARTCFDQVEGFEYACVGRDRWTFPSAWDIAWGVGNIGNGEAPVYYEQGVRRQAGLLASGRRMDLPAPVGRHTVFRLMRDDLQLFVEESGISEAHVYGNNWGCWVTLATVLVRLAGWYGTERRLAQSARLIMRAAELDMRGRKPGFMLHLRMRGMLRGQPRSVVRTLFLEDTYRATGLCAAIGARLAAEGMEPDVFRAAQMPDPQAFMRHFLAQGYVITGGSSRRMGAPMKLYARLVVALGFPIAAACTLSLPLILLGAVAPDPRPWNWPTVYIVDFLYGLALFSQLVGFLCRTSRNRLWTAAVGGYTALAFGQAALEALLDLLGVQPAPITAKWFIFLFMSAGLNLGALMLLLAFRHGRYWTAFSLSQER